MPRIISETLDCLSDTKEAFADMTSEIGSATQEFTSEISGIAIDAAGELKDYVMENPGTCAAVVGTTLLTGGLAVVAAPAIAATACGVGLLGAASTGTSISTLSGAALPSASLAALGGGTLAAGSGGMAAGAVVVAGTGAAAGFSLSSAIAAIRTRLKSGVRHTKTSGTKK